MSVVACGQNAGNGASAVNVGNGATTTNSGNGFHSGGNSGVQPTFAPTAAPTATPTSPTLLPVQYFKYATSAAGGENSSTVTFGATGTVISIATPRPLVSPDHVVLLVDMSNAAGTTIAVVATPPPGCNLPNIAPTPAPVNVGLSQAVFDCPVTATPQSSITIGYNTGAIAQIWAVDVQNTAGIDTVTSLLQSTTSPWVSGSGTGTQVGLNDIGLPFYNIWDSILTASALQNYTSMGTQGIHGTNSNYGNSLQNGSTGVAFYSNTNLTASTVPSQNITWTNGVGTENMIGEQVLMAPLGTVLPTPQPTATPTAVPTVLSLIQTTPVVAPTGQVSSVAPVWQTTPVPNHLLSACVAIDSGKTISTPTGWNLLGSAVNTSTITLYEFWKIAGASEPGSVTFNGSSADWMSANMREYAGVNLTTPFAGYTFGTFTFAQAVPATIAETPSVANTLPISCFNMATVAGTTAHTTGMTEDYSAYPSTTAAVSYVQPYNSAEGQTGTIQTNTATFTSSATWNISSGTGSIGAMFVGALAPQSVVVPTPSPTPTAAPSSTPTPVPTATPTGNGTFMGFQNGADWPTTFVPYAASGQTNAIWNTPISSNPTVASYSSAVVAQMFAGNTNRGGFNATEAGQYDYNHPHYFAQPTDPVVSINCSGASSGYCNAPDNGGTPATMRIPAVARPPQGGDHHFDVVQPDGTEITAWATGTPTGNWGTAGNTTVSAISINNCGNFATGLGWFVTGPGPTAAGYCDEAGIITAAELAAGQINHALFLTASCAYGSQYPVEANANTQQCASQSNGPALGGRFQITIAPSTILAAQDCQTGGTDDVNCLYKSEKAVLYALAKYGGYMADSSGCAGVAIYQPINGLCFQVESEEPWYDYSGFNPNYTSPFSTLPGWSYTPIPNAIGSNSGKRYGLSAVSGGWNPMPVFGTTWNAVSRWLAPCSAQQTC